MGQSSLVVVSAKALTLVKACLLTIGEGFLDSGRSLRLLTKNRIIGFVCNREGEHFCFSSHKYWKSASGGSACKLKAAPGRCKSFSYRYLPHLVPLSAIVWLDSNLEV